MHDVAWHTPSPLWSLALADGTSRRFQRPELLRFAADTFMDDAQALLDEAPGTLPDVVARYETWREPEVGWRPTTANGVAAFDPDEILKLYQPAHQRFYLVGATLACRQRGLPDRALGSDTGETASFVVRRLVPTGDANVVPTVASTFAEHGWDGTRWTALDDATTVAAAEERLPLFPMRFQESGKRTRRLLAGLVPVAARETYEAAPRASAPAIDPDDLDGDPLADPRLATVRATVRDALRDLEFALERNTIPLGEGRDVLAFALLDLAQFLVDYVVTGETAEDRFDAVADSSWRSDAPDVYDALDVPIDGDTEPATWLSVLADVADNATALIDGARDAETPLALDVDGLTESEIRDAIDTLVGTLDVFGNPPATDTTAFLVAVSDFADDTEPPNPADIPGAPPIVDPASGAVYVVRCVYERPRCTPARPPVVSQPSQAFQLASFFDPDAPTRPVRITMPVDTSLAGLRKAPKNVAVLLSDKLRSQMDRVAGVSALEDGDVGDDPEWTLGMICSLSIPIITICALIILMIIVQLLNIVFWWLPFFKICLPIPLKK